MHTEEVLGAELVYSCFNTCCLCNVEKLVSKSVLSCITSNLSSAHEPFLQIILSLQLEAAARAPAAVTSHSTFNSP